MSNFEDDEKKCKNNNLVLLESVKETKTMELNEDERQLKDKLSYIETKLESVKKVMESINQDNDDTLYKSDAFEVLVGSIAITAAVNAIAEYFNVDLDDIDNFIK